MRKEKDMILRNWLMAAFVRSLHAFQRASLIKTPGRTIPGLVAGSLLGLPAVGSTRDLYMAVLSSGEMDAATLMTSVNSGNASVRDAANSSYLD